MCYSPFRRANCSPKGTFALDLHGLATPPAFVLSQDQTLHLIIVLLEPEGTISSIEGDTGSSDRKRSDWSARYIKDATDQAKLKILLSGLISITRILSPGPPRKSGGTCT